MSKSLYLNQEHAIPQQGFPHNVPGWYGSRTDISFRRPVAAQDLYWRRFLELFYDTCGTPKATLPSLVLSTEHCFVTSDEEVALADELFVQELGKVARSKSRWRSQKISDGKTYITATAALLRLVQEAGSPAVAQCLIRKGSTLILSKDPLKQSRRISERHDLIIVAAELGRASLVDYFAAISPPEKIAEALAISVRADDVELTRKLLERGASPDSLFQTVPDHFKSLSPAILELLLRSPTQPSNSSRGRWLRFATTEAKLDQAIMLLRYGATPEDLDYLHLLRKAIEELHLQAFIIALKCMHGSGAIHVNRLLQQIVSSPDMSFTDKMLATEATLCVALSKDGRAFRQRLRVAFLLDQDTSAALEICASSGQLGLVELLCQPRFDAEVCSKTLLSAITACNLHLLSHLYPKGSARILPKGFMLTALPVIEDHQLHDRLLMQLLKLQVQGDYLDKELVLAVRARDTALIRLLMTTGAKADYNDGEALILAVEGQFVRLVQELLPQTTRSVRSAVFVRIRATEKLPRRLMAKLFVERGITAAVLHYALRDSVCESAPSRDEALIDNLTAAGADYRMVTASAMHGLVEQGDFHSIADSLKRMSKSTTSPPTMSAIASQLLDHLVHCPTKLNDRVRHQMMKLLLNHKATGDCVLLAFEEFSTSSSDPAEEDLLLFLTPTVPNRTHSYNILVSRVLRSIGMQTLPGLIPSIEIYDEILELILMGAAHSALSDDTGTAARLRCLSSRVEPKKPIFEQALDHHIRTYAKECSLLQEWPLKTIDILISKGFAGTAWLCHALSAIAEAENVDVLTRVLSSAGKACSKDIVDSVLLLSVQHRPVCSLQILELLLSFGASQAGLDMALLTASAIDQVQISALLLQYGADINYQSGACLITAVRQDRRSVFGYLLAQGNANEISLTETWILVTGPSSGLSVASKLEYCVDILKAGFRGSEVTELLYQSIASMSPDYEMITTIMDEIEALQQDRTFQGHCNSQFGIQPSSPCEEPQLLLQILACAVRSGNGRLCRLVLSYLPAGSRMPVDLLNLAASISTAVLALLVNHTPPAARQEALDLCLVHAATFAGNSATCIYLLYEGASCEALNYTALSAATKRAVQDNASDRAPLEALLASNPSQAALRSAWRIALGSLEGYIVKASQDFGILRAIKALQLIVSAGLQDLESFQNCICTLCRWSTIPVSKCEACTCDELPDAHTTTVIDCCSDRRIQAKTEQLVKSLLDHGLPADYNNGQGIIAAAQNHRYEMLEILLPRLQTALAPSEYISRHGDVRILYDHSSQTPVGMRRRLKTLRSLVRHGATCPVLTDALLVAVQNSTTNAEACQVAELLLEYRVHDESGAVIRCLADNPQPEIRHLLSSALELETSKNVRLETIETLVSSDLDDESMNSLILSALCGSSSQLLEMTREETHKILQAIAEAGKAEALTLILSCITDKSILSPFNSSSCFVVWLLRSCTRLAEHFLNAVLEWLGPEEIQRTDERGDGLCLIQEAVIGHKVHLVPRLVSSGATTITKDGKSLLYETVMHTAGESPEVLKAILSLCNDSTLNDGSLQLAVVTMRESIVTLLLEQGHDPNTAAPGDHGVPLNMLCATASVMAHESDCGMLFKRIVIKLMMHGAQLHSQIYGRSALFNALDNPKCTVGLLTNVIECFHLSDDLGQLSLVPEPSSTFSELPQAEANDDTQSFETAPSTPPISEDLARKSFFEFENETHHYSASMYLEKDVPCQPSSQQRHFSAQKKVAFLEFLRNQDMPDVYYALEGPQPADAVGVPIELLLGSTGCAVCGDSVLHIDDAFGKLTEACTHNWEAYMCRECLDGYMASKTKVENGAVNSTVSCWAEGCSNILSHYEIKRYADPTLFELYDHALLQQTIHEGETFAECSTQGCKGGGWLEPDDVSYFHCNICQQETCISHNGPRKDHAGKPCPATPEGQRYAEEEAREEAERQAALVAKNKAEEEAKKKAKAEADRLAKEKREGLKATEKLMKKISKNCPTCKVPIEKSVGCDHMTCRSESGRVGCGAEWCWNCQVLYTAIRAEGNSAHQVTCAHYRRNTYLH